MMIPEGNGGGPINPHLLLLHQILGGGGRGRFPIHGFGPGGGVVYPGSLLQPEQNPGLPFHGVPNPGITPQDLIQRLSGANPGGPMEGAHGFPLGSDPFAGANPGGPMIPGGQVPAPNLPAGTYTGNYAAQGLRDTNPAAGAQLWEHRHPGAMATGAGIPDWVRQAMMGHHEQVGGAHDRVLKLAEHIARQRKARGAPRRSLRSFAAN